MAGANTGTDPEDVYDRREYRQVALTIVNPQGRAIVSQTLDNPSSGQNSNVGTIPLRCA